MTSYGSWVVLESLYKGGVGETSVVIDAPTAQLGVLKTLRPERLQDPSALSRFRREATVLRDLHHPRIIPLVDAGVNDSPPWLVTEFVPATSYASFVGVQLDRGDLPRLDWVLLLAHDVATSLSVAHEAVDPQTGMFLGIVHRDLSANNVLVSLHGEAKVIDFGLAAHAAATRVTSSGFTAGTLTAMAPEVASGLGQASIASDVFQLGVLLYDGLTDHRRTQAFRASIANLSWATLIREPHRCFPPLASLRSDLPEALTSTVTRMLAARPEDRPRSMAEVTSILDGLLEARRIEPTDEQLRAALGQEVAALDPAAARRLVRVRRLQDLVLHRSSETGRPASAEDIAAWVEDEARAEPIVRARPTSSGGSARDVQTDEFRVRGARTVVEVASQLQTRLDLEVASDGPAPAVVPRDWDEHDGASRLSRVAGWTSFAQRGAVRLRDLDARAPEEGADTRRSQARTMAAVAVASAVVVSAIWWAALSIGRDGAGGGAEAARAGTEAARTAAARAGTEAAGAEAARAGAQAARADVEATRSTADSRPSARTTTAAPDAEPSWPLPSPVAPPERSATPSSAPRRASATPAATSGRPRRAAVACSPQHLARCLADLEADPGSDDALTAYFNAATRVIDDLGAGREDRARVLLRAAQRSRGALNEIRALHDELQKRSPPR